MLGLFCGGYHYFLKIVWKSNKGLQHTLKLLKKEKRVDSP
jgi:hypothetical protein